MKQHFVYILASRRNGTLYLGMTNDLKRRMAEHKQGLIEGFTKRYRVSQLVHIESFCDVRDAIRREKNLKAWKRVWNIRLIEETNPEWNDRTACL
jgi:putative endonuclease